MAIVILLIPASSYSLPYQSPRTQNVEQTNVPDYISQAQTAVKKYYPEYEEYFKPIFTRTYKLSTSSQNLINKKIQENFDLFEEELTSEKDKVTTILLVLENVISGQDQLSKSINNTAKGKDLIEIAEEISNDANKQARADRDQARADRDQARAETEQARADRDQARAETEQARADREKNQQRIALIQERNNKLNEIKEVINSNGISKETIGKIADKIEEYFTLFEIEETQNNIGLQTILKQYINITKQINRRPSPLGQKFIDEYNRITKSK